MTSAVHLPRPPVMCITLDGHAHSHLEQTERLCAAGARWIQLRMKSTPIDTWLSVAQAFVRLCRQHNVVSIINDNVDLAIQSQADGVHLGQEDEDWTTARQKLGPSRILGGTINHLAHAQKARASDVLDYVGIGPWRFTTTKKKLAPVLGPEGIAKLLPVLGDIPCWVIGGITADDMPALRRLGVCGAAVSAAIVNAPSPAIAHQQFVDAWNHPAPAVTSL